MTVQDRNLFNERVWSLVVRTYRWLEGNPVERARLAKLADIPVQQVRSGACKVTPAVLTVPQRQRLISNLRNEATVLVDLNGRGTPGQVVHCLSVP